MASQTKEAERCSIGKAMDQLTEEERADIQAILDNHIGSHVISTWFVQIRNIKGITAAAVTSHRKGHCSCPE